jgi:hypothetical protein
VYTIAPSPHKRGIFDFRPKVRPADGLPIFDCRLAIGDLPVPIFEFPVSNFDFPFSIFALGLITRHSSLATALGIFHFRFSLVTHHWFSVTRHCPFERDPLA